MVCYYLIATAITFLSFAALVFTFESKRTNYYFLILLLLLTLSNGGYLSIAVASDVREAILANKICYLGGCFMPLVALLLTCEICNYTIIPWMKRLLYVYSFFVYALVLTIGFSPIYYTQTYLTNIGDATVLAHNYGIGHSSFYIILYGYIIIQIGIILYSLTNKTSVSRKNLYALIATCAATIILFILGRAINPNIEIMPLVYSIDSLIFFYMYRRGIMYNIEDNIVGSVKKQNTFGYIMFDNQLNYMGCNSVALKIFPALSKCTVDRKINNISELETILQWLEKYDENEENTFSYAVGDKHHECHIERIWHKKKVCGYMMELRDDTTKWKYMNLISSYNSELENKVNEQTEELKSQQKKVKELFVQTVTALSDAVDAKDRYTSGHSRRVAEYSRMIAARMGKNKEEQDNIYRAGLLHDIGKIRIPAEIINKPGKLTDEEFDIIKLHPITGYHILKGISDSNYITVAARYHHERYDGKGYPTGLAGEKIPEIARILGVADSYDAMASNRSYRDALPQDVVRSEIEKGKGTQFDPYIAEIMLQMIDEDKDYTMKQTDTATKKILTVDDEPMNNKIISHIMHDEPMYEVICANSGKEALEIINNQTVDLIMLDVKMPEMDGLETLKLIRQTHQTPVVLMTSDKTLDTSTEFAKLGCADYITKPFLPLLIKEVIHNMSKDEI